MTELQDTITLAKALTDITGVIRDLARGIDALTERVEALELIHDGGDGRIPGHSVKI